MTTLGAIVCVLGIVLGLGGYAGLLLHALKQGFWWVVGFIVFPFFVFVMLLIDFRAVWKPLLANIAGSVIFQIGFAIILFGEAAVRPGPAPASVELQRLRGAYVPPPEPGFLEIVDPMFLALTGGIGVFLMVGLIAGAVLIGTMPEPEQTPE